ncbi:hypothetical protein M9H77_30857 [Catharanthus roseus]|uniref:Uncharacterized protein n=1 Tax=Catharanthus roseus TaxID=4058 RepID=A0ACB9ZZI0_CATRO|nr:hypothetical protein M9H77_30857 [Catharanthus roseus]
MSTQAQAPTPFREESSNSEHDDPLRLIIQELQFLRDAMRDIRRDVTDLSNQQREVSPHGSLNVTTPRSNGPLNCSRTTEFHQPPHFDEELHPPPYGGRRGSFGGRGMPRHFEEVPRPQARHGELLYDDHEHPWPKKEEAPRGTFQPPTKPKMEGRGHYASSCPTKRALIFREDLNGWIEKEEDESSECVKGEEIGEDDEHMIGIPFAQAEKLPPIFDNVLTSALE